MIFKLKLKPCRVFLFGTKCLNVLTCTQHFCIFVLDIEHSIACLWEVNIKLNEAASIIVVIFFILSFSLRLMLEEEKYGRSHMSSLCCIIWSSDVCHWIWGCMLIMRREDVWAVCEMGEVRRSEKFEERRILWSNEVNEVIGDEVTGLSNF